MIGRDAEAAAVERFVDALGTGLSGLILEGEAGIGKTTLWEHGVALARHRVCWLLCARGVEAESKLAFAALGDLLDRVGGPALESLPLPQRHALEVALLREEASEHEIVGEREIGVALLGTLRSLASVAPVVIAVDDLHWLDVPSARALAFAVRRLSDEPIGLLTTRRTGEAASVLDPRDARFERLLVGPLDEPAFSAVLERHLGVVYSRPLLGRLHRVAGGNPLYALELGRALRAHGGVAAWEELPLPDSLTEALRARLAMLSPTARRIVLVASALSDPAIDLIAAALPQKAEADAGIDEACAAGILAVVGTKARFAHPLLASTAYASLTPAERRRLHAKLASLVEDVEERAKHLALSTDEPDDSIASVLEEAAERAHARGAAVDAATLAEHAFRLTPAAAADARCRRGTHAGNLHAAVGEGERGRVLLGEAIRIAEAGPTRARALHSLGRWGVADLRERIDLQERARAEAGDDLTLLASIERQLADQWEAFDLERARQHASRSLQLAERVGNPTLVASALVAVASHDFECARGAPLEMLERAVALEPTGPDWMMFVRPRVVLGHVLAAMGELDRARSVLHKALAASEARGDHPLPATLAFLSDVERYAGRYEAATTHAEAALANAREMVGVGPFRLALNRAAIVDAYTGRVDSARARADEAILLAERAGVEEFASTWMLPRWTLGFVELSCGDASSAWNHLHPLGRAAALQGLADPSCFEFVPDQIEALVALGDVEQADRLVEEHERRARKVDRALALATGERCRALIAAARGDFDGAVAASEAALHQHERVEIPFELGRTLLTKGMIERRAKRRGAARESLGRAVAIFQTLGTPLWAEKGRAELARVSGRRPSGTALTPTEEQIARLIAEGRTNPEIAHALFVSRKTVESNLHRIYRKLGIRSRTELAVNFAAQSAAPTRQRASKA